jgi:hypothetical protein
MPKARLIRFSDFIVNEVGLDGNVTHLSDLEAPPQVLPNHDMTHALAFFLSFLPVTT